MRGHRFHQNVDAFAHQAPGAVEHQRADQKAHQRVGLTPSEEVYQPARQHHAEGADQIGDDVNEYRAYRDPGRPSSPAAPAECVIQAENPLTPRPAVAIAITAQPRDGWG